MAVLLPLAATTWRRLGWRGRARLSAYPAAYLPLYRRTQAKPELAFDDRTELVIEGFPRSANTYAVVAFESVQPQRVRIAHHVHASAQVLAAVKRDVPAMVLVRQPLDAISSLLIREPGYDPDRAIYEYIRFYEPLLAHMGRFVTAPFGEVTGEYSSVIDRLNAQFGSDFVAYERTDELESRIRHVIDALEFDETRGTVAEGRVARPSSERNSLTLEMKARLQERSDLRVAEQLHSSFLAAG